MDTLERQEFDITELIRISSVMSEFLPASIHVHLFSESAAPGFCLGRRRRPAEPLMPGPSSARAAETARLWVPSPGISGEFFRFSGPVQDGHPGAAGIRHHRTDSISSVMSNSCHPQSNRKILLNRQASAAPGSCPGRRRRPRAAEVSAALGRRQKHEPSPGRTFQENFSGFLDLSKMDTLERQEFDITELIESVR